MRVQSKSTDSAIECGTESAVRSAAPAFDRYDFAVILGCAAFLYVNLFARPGTPFLLGGDQVYSWMDAQRLLYGERVYRDFFQFTPPGTDLVYLGVFELFGPRIWTPNLVVLLLGTTLGALCLQISRSIMSRAQAILATCFYVVFVIGTTLDGTHHWFSLLAVTVAVAVLMKNRRNSGIAIAGALLGLATFITQTTGPIAALGFAIWLAWEQFQARVPLTLWRRLTLLFGSLVLTWLVLSGYYIATVGPRQLWSFQVDHARECLVSGWTVMTIGFPGAPSRATLLPLLRWLFSYAALPTVYVISLWKYRRLAREGATEKVAGLGLLTVVGTALFLEVAQSPNWFRFFCSSLPGVILLIWLIGKLGPLARLASGLLWIGVLGLAAYSTVAVRSHQPITTELPAGRVAATAVEAEKLVWLAAHTKPGQLMLQGGWPGMYLPLGLRNPIYLDIVPGCAIPSRLAYLAESVQQLKAKRVQYIVWSPRVQALEDSPAVFREFLRDRYQQVWTFSDGDEVWELNSLFTADDAHSSSADFGLRSPSITHDFRHLSASVCASTVPTHGLGSVVTV
jgi:hypothetical protein